MTLPGMTYVPTVLVVGATRTSSLPQVRVAEARVHISGCLLESVTTGKVGWNNGNHLSEKTQGAILESIRLLHLQEI